MTFPDMFEVKPVYKLKILIIIISSYLGGLRCAQECPILHWLSIAILCGAVLPPLQWQFLAWQSFPSSGEGGKVLTMTPWNLTHGQWPKKLTVATH